MNTKPKYKPGDVIREGTLNGVTVVRDVLTDRGVAVYKLSYLDADPSTGPINAKVSVENLDHSNCNYSVLHGEELAFWLLRFENVR